MSDFDLDEVICLVRAVVATNKGSIGINELMSWLLYLFIFFINLILFISFYNQSILEDYYECNGSQIPFRAFGYPSLVDFLRDQPGKFTVRM